MSASNPLNRRTFLRGTLIAGAAAASTSLLGACTPAQADQVKWDEETDIVVIGGGGAGLAAAVEAAETGQAKVIVLEKGLAVGGSTSISGGVIQAAGTSYQKEYAQVDSDTPAKHAECWLKEGEGLNDADLTTLLASQAPEAIEWMKAHGVDYVSVYGVSRLPMVADDLNVARIHVPAGKGTKAQSGTGTVHIAALNDSAVKAGVDIRLETPVTALVMDGKTVAGVKAEIDGEEKYIRAKRGVVIATGGIDQNKEMARRFAPQQYWELETGACACAPTNTGDGLVLGMSVGADLTGLGGTIGVPAITMGAATLNQEVPEVPGIWVNKFGQRFVDEASHYAYAMRAVFNQDEHIAWAIFDESVRKLGGAVLGGIWGPWSDDLSAELESGRVIVGETVEDLAGKIGVNGSQLAATLNKWNEDMANGGEDTIFGKSEGKVAMDTAPFYAVKVTSVNLGNVGGLRINSKAEVIDVFGNPIPHLYAGGMAAGGFIGPYYPGSGTAVLATVVFGRIAGASAAANTAA